MKTRYIKGILTLLMAWVVLPMMGQDFMNVYFKDGTTHKFYLKGVTEISTSQYDAFGIRHSNYDFQHIKTLNNNFVYSLNDVDSILFFKFDEEKTHRDFSSAMTATVQSLSNCESIDDAEKVLGQIKAAKGVEDAWSDGNDLYVKIDKWETVSFHFSHNSDEQIEESNNSVMYIREMIPQLSQRLIRNGHQPRVVFANQQHFDESLSTYIKKYYKPLLEEFASCGFDTCYLAKPTLDFFATEIFKYDVIFLITHGGYSNKRHRILSGEWLGEVMKSGENVPQESWDEWLQALITLNENTIYESSETVTHSCNEETRNGVTYWVGHPRIYETFYNAPEEGGIAEGTFPTGSILFNISCHSMDGEDPESSNSFAKKLTDRNLWIYYGYKGSNYRGQKAGYYLLNSLLQGKSTQRAYSDLEAKYKFESDKPEKAELLWWPQDKLLFITPTNTNPIDETKANNDFKANQYVEVEGLTTTADMRSVSYGFEYGTDENFYSKMTVAATEKMQLTASIDKGNVLFKGQLTDLEPGNTYYYRAYTYDGMHHNYGEPKSFKIEQPTNDRILMLSKEVNGATYKIYKQVLDENNVHINPDGWKCYKSALTLDITKNSNTQTYTIDDNIYLDKQESHHGGQRPCLLLDFNTNQLFVFINSKDANSNNYTMDGHAYRSSLNNISFTLEKVFTGANWGWSPYFTEASNGQLKLRHFSFAGYYAVYSTRSSNGSWSNARGESIYPDDFDAQSLEAGNVLVIGGSPSQGYTSCPDSNHPHMIDMGLPSGTKWACCNVGADKPEADGHYYSWGEIQTKNTYNWDTYEYGYYNFDEDWSHLVNIGSNIGGTRYDAATVQWGESWRMPTKKQYVELIENTNPTWTTQNDRKGFLFTSSNGSTLFLPASGYYGDSEVHQYEYYGNYWTSVLYDAVPAYAHVLYFQPNKIEKDKIAVRYYGLPVRPVSK